jgi:hypothetical protein
MLWGCKQAFLPISKQTLIFEVLLLSIEQPTVVDIGINFLERNARDILPQKNVNATTCIKVFTIPVEQLGHMKRVSLQVGTLAFVLKEPERTFFKLFSNSGRFEGCQG